MYSVLAFYKIMTLEEPKRHVKRWKHFLNKLDVTARVYLSFEGVNCQMSIHNSDLESFTLWLQKQIGEVDIKIHRHHEHAFPRLTVKYRDQLCALDKKVNFAKRATHVSAAEWTKMIQERDENTVILDVRNEYEWEVGHFKGAENPKMETFREFPKYVEGLKKKLDTKNSRVLMYCTGGIRCEFFSPLLKEAGFEHVYQLDGGVIRYGLEEGQGEWEGNLFVFDDRLVVPISDEKQEPIGKCYQCGTRCDTFYNCANMECNDLFISCLECATSMKGCCKAECQEGRCRSFKPTAHPKPFRRLRETRG